MTRPISILLFGSTGQLARAVRAGAGDNVRIRSLSRSDADFLRPEMIAEAAMAYRDVDVVINAAAYTAVDRCEGEETLAHRINAESVGALAEACRVRNVPLIHVSTNYVFDGAKAAPYDESDAVHPLNAYGRTKCAGEGAIRGVLADHVIVRTSWLYSAYGNNFVRTILRLALDHRELPVVDDQYGAPTSAGSLATAILAIATRLIQAPSAACFGTFHYANAGEATWHAFAQAILAQPRWAADIKAKLVAIRSADYVAAAERPKNGRLDCGRIERVYGIVPPSWQAELADLAASNDLDTLLRGA